MRGPYDIKLQITFPAEFSQGIWSSHNSVAEVTSLSKCDAVSVNISQGFKGSQRLYHALTHTMLYTTRLVSSVQQTTEGKTIPPTTSTEDLTQVCHFPSHRSNAYPQNLSNTQFSGHPLPHPLAVVSPTTMLPCLNFTWQHNLRAQHWQTATPPSPTSEVSMVVVMTWLE
jgi:hypothetical protein